MMNDINAGLNSSLNRERVGRGTPNAPATPTGITPSRTPFSGPEFGTVLRQQIQESTALQPLTFSGHALQRMQQRQIVLAPSERQSIADAVDKARDKGAKETLILTEKAAFVVSVRNNTVITVMDKENLKDNVFTQIDSAIII